MAGALKKNYKKITSIGEVIKVFDRAVQYLKDAFNKIKILLPRDAQTKFDALIKKLNAVRDGLDKSSRKIAKPITDCVDTLIIKLEKKDLALYKAVSGKFTPHYYGKATKGMKAFEEAKKLPFLKKSGEFKPLDFDDDKHTIYFKLTEKYKGTKTSLDLGTSSASIPATFATNSGLKKGSIKGPATAKLYRVVDPDSHATGMFWVTEEVFNSLKTRNNWRDKLAVRVDWNANGQYVTMDIPAGKSLDVWRGQAASQPFHETTKNIFYSGGAEQIVFNPRYVPQFKISERGETPWGYTDNDEHLLNNRVIININNGKGPTQQ